jgi:5-formyltetrahydrofolate cyclo-ligase
MNKSALRKEFLQGRMNLTQEMVDFKSDQISSNIVGFLKGKVFRNVHVFLPYLKKKEINTWKIISALRTAFPQAKIVAPYILPGTKEMDHFILNEETTLITNLWAIPEPDPVTSQKVFDTDIDVVLLPLLVFDQLGFRVGYGGGYYDRFLAKCRPDALKAGISFFEPIEKITDLNEFDVKMDVCITPAKVYTW